MNEEADKPKESYDLGKQLRERYDELEGLRKPWETLWQDVATYVMPRREPGMNGAIAMPPSTTTKALFDTTAVQANLTLANGQLAWMSPMEAAWFAFEPPNKKDDEAKLWLADATTVSRQKLATSNFYLAVHEFYLDRGGLGTACLYLEKTRKRNGQEKLNAECWPVGTFVIDEDATGEVDTVIRSFKLTARQAVQKFGLEKLSEKVQKAAKDTKTAGQKFEFLHAIYPREDDKRDASKMDPPNKPIAAVYLEKDTCHVCLVGGHDEMPVFVSRYLEWGTGLGGYYGWCPSFVALPEARQLNFLQMWMDAMAERLSDPPWLAPEELEGEIDANPRGVTYFSKDLAASNALPRQMTADVGNLQGLLERIQTRMKSVNDAFHVDLFQMFAQVQKQMTAREVAERSAEKLIQFSPTFARLTTELFNPLLERVFAIGLESAWFGEVPESLAVPVSEDLAFVPTPAVTYSSRIALALRALPSLGYMRTLERLQVVAQMSPDVLDNYNFDEAERLASLADGVPVEFLRSEEERDELRKARAEAQAQQAAQAQAMMAADAAAKVGRVPGDSPVGKQISKQLEAA
jgi:hypothetical protein